MEKDQAEKEKLKSMLHSNMKAAQKQEFIRSAVQMKVRKMIKEKHDESLKDLEESKDKTINDLKE